MEFKPETLAKINALRERYPQRQAALLPVLHLVQKDLGYLSQDTQEAVAAALEIPLAAVSEVVSFYTMFYKKPIGKYHIQVCHNISCAIMGAEKVISHLEDKLGVECQIHQGETTTDGRFTLTRVECLGACDGAPMAQINDKFALNLTLEKLDAILKELP